MCFSLLTQCYNECGMIKTNHISYNHIKKYTYTVAMWQWWWFYVHFSIHCLLWPLRKAENAIIDIHNEGLLFVYFMRLLTQQRCKKTKSKKKMPCSQQLSLVQRTQQSNYDVRVQRQKEKKQQTKKIHSLTHGISLWWRVGNNIRLSCK